MTTEQELLEEMRGPVLWLTINREARRNAARGERRSGERGVWQAGAWAGRVGARQRA